MNDQSLEISFTLDYVVVVCYFAQENYHEVCI
jgi:hypothetical protein